MDVKIESAQLGDKAYLVKTENRIEKLKIVKEK